MSHEEDVMDDPFRDQKQVEWFNELICNDMTQAEREFIDSLTEEQLGYVSDLCYELTTSLGVNTSLHALRACVILLKKKGRN